MLRCVSLLLGIGLSSRNLVSSVNCNAGRDELEWSKEHAGRRTLVKPAEQAEVKIKSLVMVVVKVGLMVEVPASESAMSEWTPAVGI